MMIPAELIRKKRGGLPLTDQEIDFFINGYTRGEIPDYQMSALLMAIYFQGMSQEETLTLTKTMLHSGSVVDSSSIRAFKADKHSTGGVGDKTSLILGPVVAAAGVCVPMISGRGLGHTGGTLDKLESIPGFKINQSIEFFLEQLRQIGVCFIGQTAEICPADRKIYALRDVTATVESLPLICASILSKKLAEGIDGLVLDVKVGSGAFMKTLPEAMKLTEILKDVATRYGKKVSALITEMSQPLGQFAGNTLEVQECLEIMAGKRSPMTEDTRSLSIRLAGEMLWLSGKYPSPEQADQAAEDLLVSGQALKKFKEMCILQGGALANLKITPRKWEVYAPQDGWVSSMDTEEIGYALISIRAGRVKSEDKIEHSSGIEFHHKIGSRVQKGDKVFTVYCENESHAQQAIERLNHVMTYSLQKIDPPSLIKMTFR